MSASERAAYVQAVAVSESWADSSASLTDLISRTVLDALTRSPVSHEEIDGVVLAAHDLVDGRSLSNMITAPAAGAFLRDELRVADDGAIALALASARIRAGHSRGCIVAAWGRASEHDADAISNALFDPFFQRPLGLTELDVSALRASIALREHPGYGQYRQRAADRRITADPIGSARTVSYPMDPGEAHPLADVVSVVILGAVPSAVRVTSVGFSTDAYELGDRDLSRLVALERASAHALTTGGCTIDSVDVIEVDGPSTFDEAMALEAVGAAPRGAGMEALATEHRLGGARIGGYCAPAMGLARAARAVERLGAEGARRALTTGGSVVAGQVQSATLLEAE